MPTLACPTCSRKLKVPETFGGRKINCPHCESPLMVPDVTRVPVAKIVEDDAPETDVERTLIRANPSMFRNSPVWFIVACLLVAAYGAGLLILFIWWIQCRGTTLIISNKRTTLRRGILSKSINEVRHQDVRNVQLTQTLGQRLFGVGRIGISSAGQSGVEIEISGVPDPDHIKATIDQYR